MLGARDGLREAESPAVVALPLGRWNAMGGNWSLRRVDLSIDTRLGTREVGASWNSASASWHWSFEPSYDGATFVDGSGARHDANLADGSAIPGTHWVRVDESRIATKGGLVHEFDPLDGRLVAVRWASAAWPELRYVATAVTGTQRAGRVDQCTAANTCELVYTIERDAAGNVSGLVDRAGRTTEVDRDANGRPIAARDALDVDKGWLGQRYEYQGARLSAVTGSEGERVEVRFVNGRLDLLKQIGLGDPSWTFRYLAKSVEATATLFTSELTDPLGNTHRYRFDAQRRLHERDNGLGETESWSYNGARPTSHTDRAGVVTRWVYNGDDLVEETQPSGNVRSITRAPGTVNRANLRETSIAAITDSLGTVLTRTYDSSGRIVSETNGAAETMTLEWGADESLVRVTEANGRETLYADHGEHGHAATITRNGTSWTPTYDAVGNLMHGFEAGPQEGGVALRRWDADRNLAEIVLVDQPALGARTQRSLQIEHRSDGRVSSIARPLGGDTTVFYDALGRENLRVEWASPGAVSAPVPRTTARTHDAAGQLLSVTRPNGMRRELERDAAGRIVRERFLREGLVESDVTLTYSGGRTVLLEDLSRSFAESIQYDVAGRAEARVHPGGDVSRTAFDLRSRAIRRDLETGAGTLIQRVSFGYDGADRPERIGDGSDDLIVWVRSDGVLAQTDFGNGIEEAVTSHFGNVASREFTKNGTTLAASVYSHSAAGRLYAEFQGVTSPGVAGNTSQSFLVADALQPERRIQSSHDVYEPGGGHRAYAFDHASNLVRSDTPEYGVVEFNYNAEGNRLLEASTAAGTLADWSWDEAGFAKTRGGVALEWTARGDLAVASQLSTGNELARFTFDPLGRRLSRTIDGSGIAWSHGGLLELDAAGSPVAADLGPVRIGVYGERTYRHLDLRGNVALRSDESGAITTHRSHGAYGPIDTVGESRDLEHGFGLGLELPIDAALGPVYVMGDRLYDPLIGRFLAPDPVAHWVNDFAYTMGNPVEFWDPSGRNAESIDWNVVGTWVVAAGATLGAVGACGLAVGTGGLGGFICAGALLGAAGAWAQVYALPDPFDFGGPGSTLDFDPLDFPPTQYGEIWEPDEFPGFNTAGLGGNGRFIFLEL